jgi:hypothetical protein
MGRLIQAIFLNIRPENEAHESRATPIVAGYTGQATESCHLGSLGAAGVTRLAFDFAIMILTRLRHCRAVQVRRPKAHCHPRSTGNCSQSR